MSDEILKLIACIFVIAISIAFFCVRIVIVVFVLCIALKFCGIDLKKGYDAYINKTIEGNNNELQR